MPQKKRKDIQKMKKLTVKAVCLLASAAMLTACAQNGKTQPDTEAVKTLNYISTQSISDSKAMGEIQDFSYSPASDRLFFRSYLMTDDSAEYYFNSMKSDGSDFRSRLITDDRRSEISFTADGSGYYVSTIYNDDGQTCTLVKTDAEGNDVSSLPLSPEGIDNDFYVDGICAAEDYLFVNCYNNIYVFGYDGSFICKMSAENMSAWNMVKGASGTVYVWSYSNGFVLYKADMTNKELVKAALPFDEVYSSDTYPVSGYGDSELFITDGTTFYSYDPEVGTKTELFNWIDSGVSIMEVTKIFPTEDGFICGGSAYPSGRPCAYKISETAEKPAQRKELILAGDEYSLDPYIKNQAVNFNRRDSEYRITLKCYNDIQSLNMDMLSGKTPDILMIGNETPADTYVTKGIFADMYEFIDSDSELSREDFLPNLLKASETDGKLYTFSDRFKVFTVLGKTSIFGDKMGITTEQLRNIAAQKPSGTEIFPGSCKNDILDYALYMSGSRLIDIKKGTCDFTSDYFIGLLEYANEYMSSLDTDAYFDDSFWDRYATMYADESSLLLISYLNDYADIYTFEHENFGEPATAVGFPVESGIGSAFEIETGFAISSSVNKEGAWRFVRTLLLPDYQDYVNCFPVRNDSLQKKAEKAMTHDSSRVTNPITLMGHMMLSSGTMGIGEPAQADIDKVNAVISSVQNIHKYNTTVSDIISEEASRYFNGNISSKEAAEAIQNRVQLYLSESY